MQHTSLNNHTSMHTLKSIAFYWNLFRLENLWVASYFSWKRFFFFYRDSLEVCCCTQWALLKFASSFVRSLLITWHGGTKWSSTLLFLFHFAKKSCEFGKLALPANWELSWIKTGFSTNNWKLTRRVGCRGLSANNARWRIALSGWKSEAFNTESAHSHVTQ